MQLIRNSTAYPDTAVSEGLRGPSGRKAINRPEGSKNIGGKGVHATGSFGKKVHVSIL